MMMVERGASSARENGLRGLFLCSATLLWLIATGAQAGDLDRHLYRAAPAEGRSWALIVNGDEHYSHRGNVILALDAAAHLGYAREQVVVVSPSASALELTDPATGLKGAVMTLPGTRDGWQTAMAHLGAVVGPQDQVLVYITGHGVRRFGELLIELDRGVLSASQIAGDLNRLGAGKLVLVVDPCYSGAIVEPLRRHLQVPTVVITSTDAKSETRCQGFVRPFWKAALDPRADRNGDGLVSVEEAYAIAAEVSKAAPGQPDDRGSGNTNPRPQLVRFGGGAPGETNFVSV
jgi:hypothetical protein